MDKKELTKITTDMWYALTLLKKASHSSSVSIHGVHKDAVPDDFLKNHMQANYVCYSKGDGYPCIDLFVNGDFRGELERRKAQQEKFYKSMDEINL